MIHSSKLYGYTAIAGAVAVLWACAGRPDGLHGAALLAGVFALLGGACGWLGEWQRRGR